MEFHPTKAESNDIDDAIDTHHVNNKQKPRIDDVRLSKVKTDIGELKETMKQVLHSNAEIRDMLLNFRGKEAVHNAKVSKTNQYTCFTQFTEVI